MEEHKANFTASQMSVLSQAIAEDTEVVERYFRENNLPGPTFHVDGPQNLAIPPRSHISAAYDRIVDNTRELHLLLIGPSKALRSFAHLDVMALQFIYRLKIAIFVPIHGSVSFGEIAAFVQVDQAVVRRILRFAMTNHIFREEPAGHVRHSLLSRRLVEDAQVQGAVSMLVNESFPGSSQVVESLIRNGNTDDPMQCGWVLANNASSPFYEELYGKLPERGKPVMNAMDLLARITPVDQLLNDYPWAELGRATVVDIGGGRGPDLEGLYQPKNVDRVTFMPHNFFDEQPVRGADVYFFRYIFHDWPEPQGLKILRALIPALKRGSKIVLNEFAIPEQDAVSRATYKFHRAIDMNMMVYFNGQEREIGEWKGFIEKVDPRLKFDKAYHPKVTGEETLNTGMVIVEATWTG